MEVEARKGKEAQGSVMAVLRIGHASVQKDGRTCGKTKKTSHRKAISQLRVLMRDFRE